MIKGKKDPEHPSLIHIQTHLGGKGDEILKTPQDPLVDFYQVIGAYRRTNV
jgi:hypothetical protein